MTSIASDINDQNDNSMKAIKIERNDFDESISTETSNSNDKNRGMNLKIIKLHDYL